MMDFYFDFISPYAYLGWTQVGALGAKVKHEVNPVPVLFAGILDALDTKGPAEVPARRTYVFKDILRVAHRTQVKIAPPQVHPFNPLLALRVAGLAVEASLRTRIIDALFAAVWTEGARIDSAEHVGAALGWAGIDAAPLLARAGEPEAKNQLRGATEQAIARGVFGVPTLFVDGEMFFGFESFADVERHVRGEGPMVQQEVLQRWIEIPAAATRR
jgi:2-hydroxychromene-2-carboxylate isomerase